MESRTIDSCVRTIDEAPRLQVVAMLDHHLSVLAIDAH